MAVTVIKRFKQESKSGRCREVAVSGSWTVIIIKNG